MTLTQRGLSLIELIMFIVIVSVAIVGVMAVLDVTARSSADPMARKQALAVAEAMLEEVLSKNYENDPADPGNTSATLGCTVNTTPLCRTNTVADRANYNDVDDYAGWNQSAVYALDGTLAPVTGSYTVTVAVAGDTLSTVAGKRITVSVATRGETIALAGFKANY